MHCSFIAKAPKHNRALLALHDGAALLPLGLLRAVLVVSSFLGFDISDYVKFLVVPTRVFIFLVNTVQIE